MIKIFSLNTSLIKIEVSQCLGTICAIKYMNSDGSMNTVKRIISVLKNLKLKKKANRPMIRIKISAGLESILLFKSYKDNCNYGNSTIII